jgi:hypothetical protein
MLECAGFSIAKNRVDMTPEELEDIPKIVAALNNFLSQRITGLGFKMKQEENWVAVDLLLFQKKAASASGPLCSKDKGVQGVNSKNAI